MISTEVLEAKRRLFARIIACANLLDQPFIDQPELSAWEMVKLEMHRFNEAVTHASADGWTVPRVEHDETRSVGPIVRGQWIYRSQGQSDAGHTRFYAAQLLAAADVADANAGAGRGEQGK